MPTLLTLPSLHTSFTVKKPVTNKIVEFTKPSKEDLFSPETIAKDVSFIIKQLVKENDIDIKALEKPIGLGGRSKLEFLIYEAIKNAIDSYADVVYDENGDKKSNVPLELKLTIKIKNGVLQIQLKDNGKGLGRDIEPGKRVRTTEIKPEGKDKDTHSGGYGKAHRHNGFVMNAIPELKTELKTRKRGGATYILSLDLLSPEIKQINKIILVVEREIKRLDHWYVWNGRGKAASIKAALQQARSDLLESEDAGKAATVNSFLNHSSNNKKSLVQELGVFRFRKYKSDEKSCSLKKVEAESHSMPESLPLT